MATRRKNSYRSATPSVNEPDEQGNAEESVIVNNIDDENTDVEVVMETPVDEPQVEITPEPEPIVVSPVNLSPPPQRKVNPPRRPRNIPRFSQVVK